MRASQDKARSTPDITLLKAERDRIDQQIVRAERELRAAERAKSPLFPPETALEFQRRSDAGEVLEPLVPTVDLEELAGSPLFERTLAAESINVVAETSIRGIPLVFSAPNQRALWQSLGAEHIEAELLDFIDSMHPGEEVYVDAGASTGIFAAYAAARGITTLAFEPEIENFALLNRNAYLNRSSLGGRLSAYNIALSDRDGVGLMQIVDFQAASHQKTLGSPNSRFAKRADVDYRQPITTMKLDTFLAHFAAFDISHLKIDVDGAEQALLSGAYATLGKTSLKSIFIEISELDTESSNCINLLNGLGFEVVQKRRVQNYFGLFNYVLSR